MKKDTLKVLQVVSKVCYIVTKVLMVCSIVAACLSLVSAIVVALDIEEVIKLGHVVIKNIISTDAEIGKTQMILILVKGIILMIAEAVIMGMVSVYFKNEIKEGNPFTLRGAAELKKTGIYTFFIIIGAQLISSIVATFIDAKFKGVNALDFSSTSSTTISIVLIIVSFILRYGAEQEEKRNVVIEEEEDDIKFVDKVD